MSVSAGYLRYKPGAGALVLWETEPQLPGVPGITRVLVCRGCGAILRRRVDGAAARVVGEHAQGCAGSRDAVGQPGLFA